MMAPSLPLFFELRTFVKRALLSAFRRPENRLEKVIAWPELQADLVVVHGTNSVCIYKTINVSSQAETSGFTNFLLFPGA